MCYVNYVYLYTIKLIYIILSDIFIILVLNTVFRVRNQGLAIMSLGIFFWFVISNMCISSGELTVFKVY